MNDRRSAPALVGRLAACAILLVVAGVGERGARAAAPSAGDVDHERFLLRAELGAEYDTNAHRVESVSGAAPPPLVGSAVERVVLTGALSDAVGDGQAITISGTAAAKLFDATEARNESVAIAQSAALWRAQVSRAFRLSAAGVYYEAFQNAGFGPGDLEQRRDFRSLAPTLELALGVAERSDVVVSGGYRWLVFKADRDFDFRAPVAALDWRWTRLADVGSDGADWDLDLGAALEARTFGGPALVASCGPGSLPGVPCYGSDGRRDQLLIAHGELTRTGAVLAGLGYAFQYNRSNSYGETVSRHAVTARLAASLPLGLTVAARAEALFAFYRQSVPLLVQQSGCTAAGSGCTSIEDENRSSARVELSRDLSDHLRMFARYTFYANELGSGSGTYRRHTLLLSLAFGYDGPSP